jgi:hypothetical protein
MSSVVIVYVTDRNTYLFFFYGRNETVILDLCLFLPEIVIDVPVFLIHSYAVNHRIAT